MMNLEEMAESRNLEEMAESDSEALVRGWMNPACLACYWRPCGVTWDAVPGQSWLLKLRQAPSCGKPPP